MKDWESWLQMSDASLNAADRCEQTDPRSAASRYYYAAYQAVSAFLRYCALTPPTVALVQRESWSHRDTPDMFRAHLRPFVENRNKCNDLSARLVRLYFSRVLADYSPADQFNLDKLAPIRRDTGYIIQAVKNITRAEHP